MTKTNAKKGISWLTLLGTFFALIICITASGMIYIVYPQSSRLLRLFFGVTEKEASLSVPLFIDSNAPTPFQPVLTDETPLSAPTAQPDPLPTEMPIPTPTQQSTPIPDTKDISLPASASISGIFGSPQLYTLDCEAQAAVDWARFFGVSISELEFIDRMPDSDDPTQGFVGNINGAMGRLPPDDYGVHAGPVAELLRDYGLNAHAVSGWDIQAIKKATEELSTEAQKIGQEMYKAAQDKQAAQGNQGGNQFILTGGGQIRKVPYAIGEQGLIICFTSCQHQHNKHCEGKSFDHIFHDFNI